MPHNVAINIDSIQDDGQKKNEISTNTNGQLYEKQNAYYLQYEGVSEGLEGIKTTLKIKENKVKLIRRGQVETRQEFIPEEETRFNYQTPYGTLKFSIVVQELTMEVEPTQGEINLEYELFDEQGEVVSTNYLHVEYKEE
mgnify:CR=1 FL=1